MKNQTNYPLNEVESFSTLREMITKRAENDGDKTAFKFVHNKTDMAKTYREFYLDTVYLGTKLTGMGIENKHISCIGHNSYEWLVVYLCTLSSNNVFIPIDKDLPSGDIINVINHSEANVVFCDEKYEKLFEENKDKFENPVKFVSFSDKETDGFLNYYKMLEEGKTLYDNGDMCFLNQKPNDVNELKSILYTSGTTGRSKGVMLSEKNIVSGVYYGLRVSTVFDTCLSVLPYHHAYESVCDILVSLHKGSTICINNNLKQVLNNLKKYQPSYIMLVPAVVEMFYSKIQKNIKKTGKEKGFNLLVKLSRGLRKIGIDKRRVLFKDIHDVFGGRMIKIVCGGAPIRPEIGEFFDDIGINLISGYGITECAPLVSCNRDYFNDTATVGTVLPCLKVKIDEPNAEGIGEIMVKGDVVMMGYYKSQEQTDEVLKDGWFYTGDYGKFNDKEQLMITGRKKNLIVLSNGKNVFPEEIEEYISSIPEVSEVVVYSKRNSDGDEKGLTAQIYLDPELPLSEADLKKKVSAALSELPIYKQVHEIVLRDEPFEKTTSNKIKRQKYIEQ